MNYMSTKEASEKWCIKPGVIRFSRVWAIPKDAEKPIDGRLKSPNALKSEAILWERESISNEKDSSS